MLYPGMLTGYHPSSRGRHIHLTAGDRRRLPWFVVMGDIRGWWDDTADIDCGGGSIGDNSQMLCKPHEGQVYMYMLWLVEIKTVVANVHY